MNNNYLLTVFLIIIIAASGCECKTTASKPGKISGIDISHHQGQIDWKQFKKGIPDSFFVYIKATEGKTYTDPNLVNNVSGAKSIGVHFGIYHYFRMTSGAHEQFLHYKKVFDKYHGDLIPMVDVETGDGRPIQEVQDSLSVLLNLIENEYGKKPMIYGTQRSYNTFCAPIFNSYPLYIGRYGEQEPQIKGKGHYLIWQYSENGTKHGISKSVDICKFHPKYGIQDILL